jgi:hypothetical protein
MRSNQDKFCLMRMRHCMSSLWYHFLLFILGGTVKWKVVSFDKEAR